MWWIMGWCIPVCCLNLNLHIYVCLDSFIIKSHAQCYCNDLISRLLKTSWFRIPMKSTCFNLLVHQAGHVCPCVCVKRENQIHTTLHMQTARCFYLTGDIDMCTVHMRNRCCGNPVALCLWHKKQRSLQSLKP